MPVISLYWRVELLDEYISLFSYIIMASIVMWEGMCMVVYYFSKDPINMYIASRFSISQSFDKFALRMNLQDISPIRLSLSLMGVLGLNSSFNIWFLQASSSYFFDVAVSFGGFIVNAVALIICLFMLGGMRLRAIKEKHEMQILKEQAKQTRLATIEGEKRVEIKEAELETQKIKLLTAMGLWGKVKDMTKSQAQSFINKMTNE